MGISPIPWVYRTSNSDWFQGPRWISWGKPHGKPGEDVPKNGHATGTDWFEVPKAYVREYPHNIWPYMLQYLHFRILEFPLMPPSNPLKLWFSLVVIHGYHLIFSTNVNINNNELLDRSFRENRNRSACSFSSSFRGVLDYFNHPILGMKQLRSWIPTIN